MSIVVFVAAAMLLSAFEKPPQGNASTQAPALADPRLSNTLSRVSAAAELFAASAQQYMSRESLRQRVIHSGSIRRSKDGEAIIGGGLKYDARQIESFYAFTTLGNSRAVREIRQVIKVDKNNTLSEDEGRKRLRDALLGRDDPAKAAMMSQFSEVALNGVATDLGQLILSFGNRGIDRFAFDVEREEVLRDVPCIVIRYTQKSGKDAVHINEKGKEIRESLQGWLWASLSDGIPLRITLITSHKSGRQETRDEAEVDYAAIPSGALLPASVIHRRYEDDLLAAEDDFRYADWQSLK